MQDSAKERIRNCRAQMQTDSLTVLMDLSKVSAVVADAFCQVLRIPPRPEGEQLAEQPLHAFQTNVVKTAKALSDGDELDLLEFAALLSAFFHECRHVHDLRATRIGAELLLHDLQVYSGVTALIEELSHWQQAGPDRSIPLPLPAALDFLAGENPEIADRFAKARAKREAVAAWWDAPSKGPVIPGHNIRSLFETLGFFVQIEWLNRTFGSQVADLVVEATIGSADFRNSQYFRPMLTLLTMGQARNVALDPEQHDLPQMILYALNFAGLQEAFEGTSATNAHPGTWFDRISEAFVRVYPMDDIPAVQKSAAAITLTANHAKLGSFPEIFARANDSIEELQKTAFAGILSFGFTPDKKGNFQGAESVLLATEVAIDYRDMQRLLLRTADYHLPFGYLGLLLGGELTTLHVRLKTHDGWVGDFRLPSATPSNHVGGSRVASLAAQQMRFLLSGRDLSSRNFFADEVFERLKAGTAGAPALKFRRVRV